MIKKDVLISVCVYAAVFVLLMAIAIPAYWYGTYRRECLSYGYPDVVYMVGHRPYCANVVESVPLKSLRGRQ